MINRILLCFSFSFISLYAEVEYDIILLAPEGEEFKTYGENCYMCDPININDAGYVYGIYLEEGDADNTYYTYVFHQKFGFKKVTLPNNETLYSDDSVRSVNNQGIAVGTLGGNDPYYHFYPHPVGIFVFDTNTDQCYDLLEAFGTNDASGYSLTDRYVRHLCITDDNQVIFNCDETTYIYDINQKTVSLIKNGKLESVNSKGQMIGKSWFLDPKTGVHELDSLEACALSQNGIVAGRGTEKAFIWSLEAGFFGSFDIGKYSYIYGVNDRGHVIGTYEEFDVKSKEYCNRSFLWAPEHGFLKLGLHKSIPNAINNHSQVVGTQDDKAYLWDLEHGMRHLSSLIPKNGGWKYLEEARGINDSGYIVGYGKYYGRAHHFLLIPKKPRN